MSNVEDFPNLLIGRLIQKNFPILGACLNTDSSGRLTLFLQFFLEKGHILEKTDDLFLSFAQEIHPLIKPYNFLKQIVVRVEESSSELYQWGRSEKFLLLREHVIRWVEQEISEQEYLRAWKKHRGRFVFSSYQAYVRKKKQGEFRNINLLNRIPGLLLGILHQVNVFLDEVNLKKDTDNLLVLYTEFSVNEENKHQTDETILSIAKHSGPFFLEYPELQRLKIWTKPDYDDTVSIRPVWIHREKVLAWSESSINAQEFLSNKINY